MRETSVRDHPACGDGGTLLAEPAPEPPVGFIHLVPSRDEDADAGPGEVNARARRFYERSGWAPDEAEKGVVLGGVVITEVRYRRAL